MNYTLCFRNVDSVSERKFSYKHKDVVLNVLHIFFYISKRHHGLQCCTALFLYRDDLVLADQTPVGHQLNQSKMSTYISLAG